MLALHVVRRPLAARACRHQGGALYEVWANRFAEGGQSSVQSRSARVTDTMAPGVFHHLVVTYDGQAISTLFDGTPRPPLLLTGAVPDTGDTLVMGCASSFAAGPLAYSLEGWTIEEVAVDDRPITATRVQEHYARGTAAAKP